MDYDMMDEMKVYEEIIKENISFGDLLIAHPLEKETIEGIMQLILETVLNKNQTMLIARMDKEQQKDALAQLEAMISDEEKHEKPDYEKVQEILDKYSDVDVNTDNLVHAARRFSACFPVIECILSAA